MYTYIYTCICIACMRDCKGAMHGSDALLYQPRSVIASYKASSELECVCVSVCV